MRIMFSMKMWAVYNLEDTSVSHEEALDAFYRLYNIYSNLS
jgi:hypothetical protein